MTAIDPRDTVRYTVRLFGYFLTVAIVGGAITVGGAVLLREANVYSGGSVDVGAEMVVGGILTGVGALVVLAGLFAIVLNVIADAVRFGVEGTTATTPETEQVTARAPPQPRGQYVAAERVPPAPRRPPAREPDRGQQPEGATERSEEGADDEAWKHEVEEKLAEEDRPEQADSGHSGRSTAQSDDSAASAGGSDAERSHTGTTTPSNGDAGARSGQRRGTAGEREAGEQSQTRSDSPAGTAGQETTEEGTDSDSETWVSGEAVNEGERTDTADSETGGEDPLAPGGTADSDATEAADADTDSPAWLEEATESDDESR